MGKKFLILAAQFLVALFVAFLIAIFFNGWVFSTPPGSREQGFPFAYAWFDSSPPTYLNTLAPPGFAELPRSGWIVRGLVLDVVFYTAISIAMLLGYRYLLGSIRHNRNH